MKPFGKYEKHHKKEPMKRILDSIAECLTVKCGIEDNAVVIPKWGITVRPEIEQLTDSGAVINFYTHCADWEEPLFECCAGFGRDTDTAIGTAVGSFLFSFLQGVQMMMTDDNAMELSSEFNGKKHTWSVYSSNMVGLGENVGSDDTMSYWSILREHIAKRLGNQRMCYVKVYAAKAVGDGENITGECRVNDVPSDELGALIAEVAAKWDVTQFASQKQFFFIRQDEETLLPYPFEPSQKLTAIREKVRIALDLFLHTQTQVDYENLPEKLEKALGDATLAQECFSFLPEICAEHAFNEAHFSEQLQFCANGKTMTVYKNQLADFFPIGHQMFRLFDDGVFGEATNDLYKMLIAQSAICNSMQQLIENGGKPADSRMTALIFNVSDNFEIR